MYHSNQSVGPLKGFIVDRHRIPKNKPKRKKYGQTDKGVLGFLDKISKDCGYENYSAYLKSPHWTSVKRFYRESDFPQQCVSCGVPYFILHHLSYENFNYEDMTELMPLCDNCHNKVNNYLRQMHLSNWYTGQAIRDINEWTLEHCDFKFRFWPGLKFQSQKVKKKIEKFQPNSHINSVKSLFHLREEIIADTRAGLSIDEIASKHKVDPKDVFYYLKRYV